MSESKNELLAELDRLLARNVSEVLERERTAWDLLTNGRSERLVLCGAGGLGRHTLHGLRKVKVEPMAFTDNNPALWGQAIEGIPVLKPADAVAKFGVEAAFIVTIWGAYSRDAMADRIRQWTTAGCSCVVSFLPLFWKFPQVFLPHWTCDSPHKVLANADRIRKVAAIWSNFPSLREFCAQVQWRLEGDFSILPAPAAGIPYFSTPFVQLRAGESFVDCGAYNGDTLRDFLANAPADFANYTALEPDPQNYNNLRKFLETCAPEQQQRIEVFPYAVYSERKTLRFAAAGSVSSSVSSSGTLEVQGETLDALFAKQTPTFIKMDIEGAETHALRGGASLLPRSRPVVAASAYHVQEHVWEIPELLASMLQNYSFSLVPHLRECWDLVCYAAPNERQTSSAHH